MPRPHSALFERAITDQDQLERGPVAKRGDEAGAAV
jgi:hypothetical protein